MKYPTVPVARSGCDGYTSCCSAATTIVDGGFLVCKACYKVVYQVLLSEPQASKLDDLIQKVWKNEITHQEAIEEQMRLLLQPRRRRVVAR